MAEGAVVEPDPAGWLVLRRPDGRLVMVTPRVEKANGRP
jgi:hypothetical protein